MRKSLTRGFVGMLAAMVGTGFAATQDTKPTLAFNGYLDLDFKTLFSKNVSDPNHTYGLEMKLTTTVDVAPNLKGYLYTAAYDGLVPGQGANVGNPVVQYDGFTLDWETKPGTHVYAGDQITGQGYFNYYYYKRSAMVVGKHYVRGAAFSSNGWYVQTGADLLPNATGTGPAGAGTTWSTFAKYDYPLTVGTLTPSLKYQAGVPGAYPTNLGLSYVAKAGDWTLNTQAGLSYDGGKDSTGAKTDLGYTLLIEPTYATGPWTFSGTVFLNHVGNIENAAVPKGSYGHYPAGYPEDLLVYMEPDYAVNDWLTVGSTFEYHNYTKQYLAITNLSGPVVANDEFWIVPTVYFYPGKGVTWLVYGQAYLKGIQGNNGAHYPYYQGGSEVVFNF